MSVPARAALEVFAAFAVLLTPLNQVPAQKPSAEAEVLAAEEAWRRALIRRDSADIALMLDVDFRYITAFGALLDRERRLVTFSDGDWVSIGADEVTVKVYGDVAVVTMRNSFKGSLARAAGERQDIPGEYRTLRVWIKRDGQWRFLAGQNTALRGTPPNIPRP